MSIIPVGGNTGMPSWYSPRVFITYARENSELAKIIRDRLTAGGFFVFLDVREILTGEYFARVIERALRRCDSVVAIVSVHSVRSNWCVAELVQAHTLGKPIAPVLAEPVEITFPEPLKFLLEPLHYISATQPASYSVAVNELEQHLLVAKRRRTGRILKHISFGLLGTILIVLGSVWAIRSINAVGRERDREDVLARVSSAASTLNRGTIDNLASRLPGDRELSQRLMFMTQNQDLSDVQRINAVMLANKLLAPQLRQLRWYLKDLHWDDAALLRTSISNITFMSGDISRTVFSDVSFGGVLWNESPLNGHPGLMLSSLDFNKCRFDGGWFRGTGSVGVRFTNCRFQGTSLDVRNMGATSFRSLQANPSSSVITDEVSVFENVVISRCVPPPQRGVMEIVPSDSEVSFDGVIFDSCRFRGRIRPTWFRNCSFQNCVLPKAITANALLSQGNQLNGAIWQDEACEAN